MVELATALHDSIRSGIKNTLGEGVMETLLSHLKSPLQSYAAKPREFHNELHSIFGNAAAGTLERMIVKDLFHKLNVLFPRGDDLDFGNIRWPCETGHFDNGRGPLEMSANRQLFDTLLSSVAKGDLLVLFHKNPGLIDSIDGVARRIGRIAQSIQGDVNDLVALGVLRTKRIGSKEVIFLDRSRDKETEGRIANYLKGLKLEKTE